MQHSQLRIGLEFWCGARRYRCTDLGHRVVVAIRIDGAEVSRSDNGKIETRVLSGAEAQAEGWFSGPPYAVAEQVFDENDLAACRLEAAD